MGGKKKKKNDDDDDDFFESLDRVPSCVSIDFDVPSSSDDDDDDYDDVRFSFSSAVAAPQDDYQNDLDLDDDDDDVDDEAGTTTPGYNYDYGVWTMAEPISIHERRRLLLQGMGFTSSKDMVAASAALEGSSSGGGRTSRRHRQCSLKHSMSRLSLRTVAPPDPLPLPLPLPLPPPQQLTLPPPLCLTRSQSLLLIRHPPPLLRRATSAPPSLWLHDDNRPIQGVGGGGGGEGECEEQEQKKVSPPVELEGEVCKIKNLDTGKEFVVSKSGKDGTRGSQTGLQLTFDEFERFLGYSPIVKDLMRRVSGSDKKKREENIGDEGNAGAKNSKSSSSSSNSGGSGSRRKSGGWLKNIASSVTGLLSEKERDCPPSAAASSSQGGGGNELMKVRHHGKSHRELSGLYMCQQIQAHQGSIWCIKFSSDYLYLASAGEDHAVHVWQVIQSDTVPSSSSLLHQQDNSSSLPPLPPSSKSAKKATRRVSVPDFIVMPKTISTLSEKPVCSLEGHLDEVLDLSWSKSQYLLSSSMDKTVRLWDVESKACLKLFTHNDYVTCIQFNPVDDRYFISGSLDAKVRIWSIPDRQVVDWTDLHEMVTAVCYTPDGQGALVGSHKGICRFYNTSDCKLNQERQIDIQSKKKKSHAKKITGFQFSPGNPSEVLVTSADSQIRIFDGIHMIHKFRGLRNTSSQISASFTSDGKFIVCASEDSQVYLWKRNNVGAGGRSKGLITTRSHEHFFCKDVSVAITLPCTTSNFTAPSLASSLGKQSPALDSDLQQSASTTEDNVSSSRSHNPPIPSNSPEHISSASPEVLPYQSHSESGTESPSVVSPSPSQRSDLISSASVSASTSSSSSGRYSSGSTRNNGLSAENAWGLVVVTAGLGGDIKIFQNFGLPLRLSRQTNLF